MPLHEVGLQQVWAVERPHVVRLEWGGAVGNDYELLAFEGNPLALRRLRVVTNPLPVRKMDDIEISLPGAEHW